jgi:hypothetical protein
MFTKHSVKLTPALYERACAIAEKAGYSSVDEFVTHALEKELALAEDAEAKEAVVKQLKGLGYLE